MKKGIDLDRLLALSAINIAKVDREGTGEAEIATAAKGCNSSTEMPAHRHRTRQGVLLLL
jgi:hypothetical protein